MSTLISIFTKRFFINSLLEFGPILLFAICFHLVGPYQATLVLMISTLISTFITFWLEKRIPYIPIYIALITLIFGYFTLQFKNFDFIQIRDTFYDFTFATTLVVGLIFNKLILKLALSSFVSLSEESWRKLTYIWIFIFLFFGILNEFVRRNHDTHIWLNYKIGIIFATIFFIFFSLYFVLSKESDNSSSRN